MWSLRILIAVLFSLLGPVAAHAAATILPPPETCFQALTPTSGGPNGTGTGFVGLLGPVTAGAGGTSGVYGGVALTGGNGSNATANVTVSGGGVTQVQVLNPGVGYVVGDVLSATPSTIGGTLGFSVSISSIYINQSLAGGSVTTYIPSTNTLKSTWFNTDQAPTHQNSNPITLDANGCAIIIGVGSYRFVVKDSLGNIIYDQVTTDTSAQNNSFWAGVAGGTPNNITVVDAGFNNTDGSEICFIPISTNTGAVTLTPSGTGIPVPVVKDTSTGAVSLTGGEIVANSPSNVVCVVYSATEMNFHILNLVQPASTASATGSPQGYLNLVGVASGSPVQGTTDVTSATVVYYSPYKGNQIPIWNGATFTTLSFSELQVALSSTAQAGNQIYDICVFNSNGVPILVFGPAWTSATAGSSARGTGAGTAQLTYQNGILVNAVAITANNGSTNYTVPARQCTYVGSMLTDGNSGFVSAYRTAGATRKWGIWNAYNRLPILLQTTDTSNTTWTYSTATFRQAAGNTNNVATAFTGLAEEPVAVQFAEEGTASVNNSAADLLTGIGLNSTTLPSGLQGKAGGSQSSAGTFQDTPYASFVEQPFIGVNNFNPLESATGTWVITGGVSGMYMLLRYNG